MSPGPVLELSVRRRHVVRYNLQLPAFFHWNDGIEHTGAGLTSDVSLDGALILSSTCPPVGTDIRIEILIPSPDRSGEGLRIECNAKVSRVLDEEEATAFCIHGNFDDDHLTCLFRNPGQLSRSR
jgi:hypothetical protein